MTDESKTFIQSSDIIICFLIEKIDDDHCLLIISFNLSRNNDSIIRRTVILIYIVSITRQKTVHLKILVAEVKC